MTWCGCALHGAKGPIRVSHPFQRYETSYYHRNGNAWWEGKRKGKEMRNDFLLRFQLKRKKKAVLVTKPLLEIDSPL